MLKSKQLVSHDLSRRFKLEQCFSTGVLRNLKALKGSAESNQEMGIKRHLHIFWAPSVSKMHLWSMLCPEPHWGSLQHSPRPTSLLSVSMNFFPALGLRLRISRCLKTNFWLSPWVRWAIKIAAKSSTSKKRLNNTELENNHKIEWEKVGNNKVEKSVERFTLLWRLTSQPTSVGPQRFRKIS